MTASKKLLLVVIQLLCLAAQSQKVLSLEYKFSSTKYMLSKSNRQMQNSTSKQLIAGGTKEVTDGLRLGFKAGVTVDKVYSNLMGRNTINYSRNNVLAYLGANVQKCLLGDHRRRVSLWSSLDVAAEPFISRKSIFTQYFPIDSFPENTMIDYNAVYADKRIRFTITPMLKVEIWITKHIGVFAQAGYAIEVGKSNTERRYLTNSYTLENLPEAVPGSQRIKENYLFAGGGISYAL